MLRTKPFISPEKNLLAVLFVLLLSLLLFPQQASAIFLNGDFEAGEFNYWTESHGLNPGLSGAPPFQASDIHIDTGGASLLGFIGRSFDPRAPQLSLPRQGNRIARLNDEQSGQHINRLTQQDTLTEADRDPVDGKLHIRFSYAAVLQSSNLPPQQQAYYHIQIKDIDDGAILYTDLGHAGQSGRSYYATVYGGQVWHSTSYIDLDLEIPDSRIGHAIEIQLHAAGSADGSAAGYLYTDALGSSPLAAQSPCLNGLAARSKPGKIQLTWPDSGAEKYRVYRADAQTGPYTQLAETNSHYSTWLDQTATNGQSYYYTVRPLDASGTEICSSAQVTVVAPPPWEAGNTVNRPPYFTSTPPVTGTTGSAYTYVAQAQDADGDPLTYQFLIAPQGMTIHAVSGAINWTPGIEGRYNVTVQASDPSGSSATQAYFITIASANRPPSITNVMTDRIPAGTPFTHQILATDPDGDALHYSIKSAINGITLNASGQIDWTDPQPGAYPVTLLVADPYGATDTQNLTLTVYNGPYFTSSPITVGTAGTAYTYTAQAQNDDGDPITYSLTQHPAGMSINAASGQISWTPTAAGNETVTVKATDPNNDEATQTYTLVISPITIPNRPPQISSVPTMSGTVGVAYTYPVIATDPDGDLLAYTLSTAPAGMTVDAAGQINWAAPTVGAHPVAVRVSDGQMWVEQNYTLTISAGGGEGGNFTAQLSATPEFINAGESVAVLITFSGGKSPYTVVSLTLDGAPVTVSGNSATVSSNTLGLHTLIVTAKDANGTTVTEQTTFAVRDPNDNTYPVAEITAPAQSDKDLINAAEITTITDIIGTASDDNLAYYTLHLSPTGENQWREIGKGTSNIVNGKLGVVNPQTLANGQYDLKLTAVDTSGHQTIAPIGLIVRGEQKIGQFALSFVDFELEVAGLPLRLTRSYDTLRQYENLDFGYGWSVNYQDIKIQTNGKPGREWELYTKKEGFFTYNCARPHGNRVVTVRLPDGKMERFDFKATPECAPLATFDFTVGLIPRAGTTSTLEATDLGSIVRVHNGTLIDYGTQDKVDPQHYKLTARDGTIYTLDKSFGIRQIKDRRGNTLTYTKDGITHSDGASLIFTRDAKDRINKVTAPDGRERTYTYDGDSNLQHAVDPKTLSTRFTYHNTPAYRHQLDEIYGADGKRIFKAQFDTEGRLISQTDGKDFKLNLAHDIDNNTDTVTNRNGNTTVYVYDDNGNITEITDANGHITAYEYDAQGNETKITDPLGHAITRKYDNYGNITEETNALGHSTQTDYNANGNPTKLKDELGRTSTNVYDNVTGDLTQLIDAAGKTTHIGYSVKGDFASFTDPLGHASHYGYTTIGGKRLKTSETDAAGNTTTYEYDAAGNQTVTKQSVTLNSVTTTLTTHKTYDANGNLLTDTDPAGRTTTYEYDTLNQLTQETDAQGRITRYTWNERGEQTGVTYPDGSTSTTAYDKNGNQTQTCERGLCSGTTYDALDRPITNTDAAGHSTHTEYDAAGNTTRETDALGNATRFEYDAAGRQTKQIDALGHETISAYDPVGNLTQQTDANGHTTGHTYNERNQRTQTQHATGSNTQQNYDDAGRKTSDTDGEGHQTRYGYDALGQLDQVTDALNHVTTYGYDERGQLTQQTDAESHTTNYDHNITGQRTRRTLPDGLQENWNYDAAGQLTQHTAFNGDHTYHAYDPANNQLLKTDKADGSTLTYTRNDKGHLTQINDTLNGTLTYTPDTLGRTTRLNTPNGQLDYIWDANNNKTAQTVQGNGKTQYTYDARGRVSTITAPDTTITTLDYDAVGNRTQIKRSNGSTSDYTYNAANQLTQLTHRRADHTELGNFTYTLDQNGRRTRIEETINGQTRTLDYAYDAVGKLLQEKAQEGLYLTTTDYTYDAVGNRLTKTVNGVTTTYQYNANDQLRTETTGANTTRYHWDANGNLSQKETPAGNLHYTWNADNKLTGIDDQSTNTKITYTYDAESRRTGKTTQQGGTTTETQYLIDAERPYSEIVTEKTSINGGSWQERQYLHTPDGVGDLLSQTENGQTTHLYQDGQGSTRLTTDNGQVLKEILSFDAFGNRTNAFGQNANTPTSLKHLYVGEYYDQNSGLYHLRARDYDPNVGRFTARDEHPGTLRQPLTKNLHLYVNADPINFVDPSGNILISMAMPMPTVMRGKTIEAQGARFTINKIGCKLMAAATEQAINYGIYVLTDGLGRYYVGQSNDIDRRFKEHVRKYAKIKGKGVLSIVAKFSVDKSGGKDLLRIVEQYIYEGVLEDNKTWNEKKPIGGKGRLRPDFDKICK